MNTNKTYTIFAGVNGAGKSTLFGSNYLSISKNEERINTDEMVARIGDWKDKNLQIKCAKEAVKLINFYIKNGISFNQETTLCGKSIISNIKKAKQNGFIIKLRYVYVSNYNIAIERVLKRVTEGGHGIAPDLIKKRFEESFKNLKEVINLCDEIAIFSNDDTLTLVAWIYNGKLRHVDPLIDEKYKQIL